MFSFRFFNHCVEVRFRGLIAQFNTITIIVVVNMCFEFTHVYAITSSTFMVADDLLNILENFSK